jgi:hypothetical protein
MCKVKIDAVEELLNAIRIQANRQRPPTKREMLCNWKGAGRAIGKPDTKGWYLKNKDKMLLGHETRQWIEQQLSIESV